MDKENRSLPPNNLQLENPFGALLQSAQVMDPELNVFGAADVVSTAGVLHKLFRILDNKTSCEQRFDIEWRDKTLLLSKWNKDPSYDYTYGCGAGFELATCDYPAHADDILKQSQSHHRVVFYRFAGLKFIVQSEVDAYCCSCDHSPADLPTLTPSKPRQEKKRTVSDSSPRLWQQPQHHKPKSNSLTLPLSDSYFSTLTIDDPGNSPALTPTTPAATEPMPSSRPLSLDEHSALQIHHTNNPPILARCLIELKTQRANYPQTNPPEAQLYFSRRNKLYVAQHERGRFQPAPGENRGVRDMTVELRKWEESREVQIVLGKVAEVLRVVKGRVGELERDGGVDAGSTVEIGEKKGLTLICRSDGSGEEEGVEVELWERELKK